MRPNLLAGLVGGARSFLMRPNGAAISGTATPHTSTFQNISAVPFAFSAVRIHYAHWGGSGAYGPMTGASMLVAASDDIGNLDLTDLTAAGFKKCLSPWAGGVEYPDRRASVTTPGWADVTWSGSSTLSIADPGSGNVTVVSSDIIPLVGTLDATNNVYPTLVRIHFGSAGYTYINTLKGANAGSNLKTEFPTRPNIAISKSGGNYVTTPTSWKNSTTGTAGGDPYLAPNCAIEYFSSDAVLSAHLIGDSRFGVSAEFNATNNYRSTEMYLHNALVALGKKPAIFRGGISSAGNQKANTVGNQNYYTMAAGFQAAPVMGARWIIYLIYSVNDGIMSGAMATACIAQAAAYKALASTNGQRICFLTCFPKDGGFTAPQLTNISDIRSWAAVNGDAMFDPIVQYGDTSGAWASYRFDASHMTDAGYQDMVGRIAALLT